VRTSASIDAVDLLRSWQSAGLVSQAELPGLAEAIVIDAAAADPPLHLKILAAVGTLFATGFFLAFLAAADLISFEAGGGLVAWGAVFLGSGIALSLALRRRPPCLGHDFVAQVGFVGLALGKVALVAGAVLWAGEETRWVATATLLGATVVTYPVTGPSLDRFLSPYAVAASVLFEILARDAAGTEPGPALAGFVALAVGVAAATLVSHRVPTALRPIGTAALAAIGTVVGVIAAGHDFGIWATDRPIDSRPVEVLLALTLSATIAGVAHEAGALRRPPVIAAIVGGLVLGFAGAPGIVFALVLMIVGHARHDVPIRITGILALPAFVALWYWGRDLDFLAKSAVLAGSGGLLLAARAVMARAGWDREEDA
jgi:hypothetical protein